MLNHARLVIWLAAFASVSGQPTTTDTASITTPLSSSSTASSHSTATTATYKLPETCRSGTVNYITHGLPQQCHKTNHTISDKPTIKLNTSLSTTNSTSIVSATQTQIQTSVVSNNSPSQYTTSTSSSHAAASNVQTVESSRAVPSAAESQVEAEAESEIDSPLDNAKFLSYEDWKRQNLEKVGQSPEALAQARAVPPGSRQRPGFHNALDSLGEDSEIEIDFSGFGASVHPSSSTAEEPEVSATVQSGVPRSAALLRNKDAGKTCKERFNYASFDCAANVLKTNNGCKSSVSVLMENKDSYMLNKCSIDNKFLIVELCEAVLIDTVVLANFEFFSSMFRQFKVSVSDRYPVKLDKWKTLGTYEARNTREIQAFLVENPMIYARYLRIELLNHYGAEYYCPLSLVRVHGTTMMEEYRRELALANGEIEEEEEEQSIAVRQETDTEKGLPEVTVPSADKQPEVVPSPPFAVGEHELEEPAATPQASTSSAVISTSNNTTSLEMCPLTQPYSLATPTRTTHSESEIQTCAANVTEVQTTMTSIQPSSTVSQRSATSMTSVAASPSVKVDNSTLVTSHNQTMVRSPETAIPSALVNSTLLQNSTSTQSASSNAVSSATTSSTSSVIPAPSPQPPATQESFFKSIHKRLQALEANSTLSLQYIESQSQLLRDAFAKVEKRNLQKTSTFLESLNNTVLAELSRFKIEYEQLWHSTVIELASQREEGKRERDVLGDRIRMLAEEMVAQKRLMAAQATLLLLCLGLVVFGRFGSSTGVDIALAQGVQGLVHKGRSIKKDSIGFGRKRWQWDSSPWNSPRRQTHANDQTRPATADAAVQDSGEDGFEAEDAADAADAKTDERDERDERNEHILMHARAGNGSDSEPHHELEDDSNPTGTTPDDLPEIIHTQSAPTTPPTALSRDGGKAEDILPHDT